MREWRALVAKRHLVRARVAALLGKMLDATFAGWARLARRRAAARASGAEVFASRRAVVCRRLLDTWSLNARLSGTLAVALRSLFLRSAFSVFAAWAAWAR